MGTILVWIAEHFKKMAIITIVIGIVFGLGATINALIPWEYLTIFFKIIRDALEYIDFMVNTNALIASTTIILSAKIAYIGTRATMMMIKYFE